MARIYRFNEDISKDLREEFNLYLSYLLEEGYTFSINQFKGEFYTFRFHNKGNIFEWGDIKNEFIPFISTITNRYTIASDIIDIIGEKSLSTSTEKVLTNMIINNIKIHSITFLFVV